MSPTIPGRRSCESVVARHQRGEAERPRAPTRRSGARLGCGPRVLGNGSAIAVDIPMYLAADVLTCVRPFGAEAWLAESSLVRGQQDHVPVGVVDHRGVRALGLRRSHPAVVAGGDEFGVARVHAGVVAQVELEEA